MYRKIAWSQMVGANLIKTRYALISVRIPLETLRTNVKLNKNNKVIITAIVLIIISTFLLKVIIMIKFTIKTIMEMIMIIKSIL